MKQRTFRQILFSLLLVILTFSQCFSGYSLADKPVRLIVDGKDITSLATPIYESGKVLLPIQPIVEKLGGKFSWNRKDNKVTITKDNLLINLKVDSRLVSYQEKEKKYSLIDETPKIVNDRIFVPISFISSVLGVEVKWDENNKTISVDSSKELTRESSSNIKISTLNSGQAVKGKTELQVELSDDSLTNAKEIKYLLLNPNTSEGFVIARGKALTDKYTWIPSLEEKGEKVLVAALYDEKGNFLTGDAISVLLDIKPKVSLTGVGEGETLEDTIYIGADTSFLASYIKYEITNLDTGKTNIIGEEIPLDPYGQYKWEPKISENGNYSFKVTAYDANNKPYKSEEVKAKVQVSPKLELMGVSEGQTIDRPVSLLASRNFEVKETQYILRDPNSGEEEIIAQMPYGDYKWFPGPEISGEKEVLVRVVDTKGVSHESQPISISLTGNPILLLEGVGPNQVLRESTKLRIRSNIKIDSVSYILINKDTGKEKIIAKDKKPSSEEVYTPTKGDSGYWNIQAIGKVKGNEIKSELIPIRVYLGNTHNPLPIIEKDKYLDLASGLAKDSWKKTGMSAALQTAQSILETGWGQSVPVDKYTGKLSYNLFGIKGKGPKGSVIINTWEVYNGKTYRVDADFRAYNNAGESWADHKSFLLNSSRYEPFKEVMHDSTQGAWALKRTGYATDPEYALKLMRIIKQYNLQRLDRIKI